MEAKYSITVTLIIFSFFLLGCEESIVSIDSGEYNLIRNSSFEKFFNPSLDGWVANSDTPFVKFSRSTPRGGGFYSVALSHAWSFPGMITYEIVPPIGTHRYELSVWGKSIQKGFLLSAGRMSILIKREDVAYLRKWAYFSDSTWTYGSLIDTLTTDSLDTIIIMLSGSPHQFASGYVLFDMCKFVRFE
jgi:hypothetical protein